LWDRISKPPDLEDDETTAYEPWVSSIKAGRESFWGQAKYHRGFETKGEIEKSHKLRRGEKNQPSDSGENFTVRRQE